MNGIMVEIISDGTAQGPYSTAVKAAGFVFLSGQGGIDPSTGRVVAGGIAPETVATVANIASLLRGAGMDLADLVSVTCYLADISEWEAMNAAYASAMGDARPVRTAVEVSALPFGLRIEMTAIAQSEPALR